MPAIEFDGSNYCWTCRAQQLGMEEAALRDAAQQLLMEHPQKFALTRRTCQGCGESDSVLAAT